MSKKKSFRSWMDDEDDIDEIKMKKRDGKRYDKKKDRIQRARRQKRNMKNSFFDE